MARIARREGSRPALTLAGLVALGVLLVTSHAWARSVEVVPYAYEHVWPAALRYLRLEENAKVVEKDGDAGYILFELPGEPRTEGALELVRVKDPEGRDATRLVLSLTRRPSYEERLILKRLARRLRDERGEPLPPPPRKDEKKPKDEAPPKDEGPEKG